ncbi:MAG: hypothetical protein WCK46_00870 [Candidatus Adlerbacteria bacterium]
MALPEFAGPILLGRYPNLYVAKNEVVLRLGGIKQSLKAGQKRSYKRHGEIEVYFADKHSGYIRVTLPNGQTHDATIPANAEVTLVDGKKHTRQSGPEIGFVCPDWALEYWDPDECTILKCTDGAYAVVDHSVQQTIFVGRQFECEDFLEEPDHYPESYYRQLG